MNDDILRMLDNQAKLLYVLRENGPLQFEEIVNFLNPIDRLMKEMKKDKKDEKRVGSQENDTYLVSRANPRHYMSRGTISKHLNEMKNAAFKNIEQIAEYNDRLQRTVLKYRLTPRGESYINQLIRSEENVVKPEQFELIYKSITDFFENRGLEKELYLPQIIKMIARIDQVKFFRLPQNDEMYLTLFYVYSNMLENSVEVGRLLYFALNPFCETYNVSKLTIQYNLEKLLKADLGIYRVPWNDELFFQRNDLVGAVLFNLAENAIEMEIVRRSLKIETIQLFSAIANEIADKMVQLQLIRPQLENIFLEFTEALLILIAITRGFKKPHIADYWPPLNYLLKTVEGADLSKIIFGQTTHYEKLIAIQRSVQMYYSQSKKKG